MATVGNFDLIVLEFHGQSGAPVRRTLADWVDINAGQSDIAALAGKAARLSVGESFDGGGFFVRRVK